MTKRQLYTLLAISQLGGAWGIYDFVRRIPLRDVKFIAADLSDAQNALQRSPPGIESAEEFVEHLKSIDTRHAPTEVKQALVAYTEAAEQGVAAAKAHQDTTTIDQSIAERQQALLTAINKCR